MEADVGSPGRPGASPELLRLGVWEDAVKLGPAVLRRLTPVVVSGIWALEAEAVPDHGTVEGF